MIGEKYGRLIILREVERSHGTGRVECLCDCGNYKTVYLPNLMNGRTKSCGCLMRERVSETQTTHGNARGKGDTPEYTVWCGIIGRCENPRNRRYNRYGGRGISICQRWRSDFSTFLMDMGPRPSSEYSIDRIDNDGNYCPENCRWVIRDQQARNRSSTRLITIDGRTLCLKDWSESFGLPYGTVRSRIDELGWSVEKALTTPLRKARS